MKNKFFKRIMSLVLVMVMAVSTMTISAVSASAKTTNVTYSFEFQTAGSSGKSSDKILIKVNGDNGSTSWHNVGKVANERTDSASFDDIDVGNIQSITVKNDGSDGWYPEIITTSKINGNEKFTTHFYGGRWVDDKNEVTLSVTDRVAKVTVKTSGVVGAGTDADVYVQLFDEEDKSSEKINLSELHPKVNAFERNDKSTFYILLPEYSSSVGRIDLYLDTNVFEALSDNGWELDYIDVTLDGETQRFYQHFNNKGSCIHIFTAKIELIPAPYTYKVTVKTSDKYLAGTDNLVSLLIYDSEGNIIRSFTLDNSDNNFERNDTDVFYISTSSKIVNIKTSKKGSNDWHCDYVQLDQLDISKGKEDVVESVQYKFNKWIDNGSYKPTSVEVLK